MGVCSSLPDSRTSAGTMYVIRDSDSRGGPRSGMDYYCCTYSVRRFYLECTPHERPKIFLALPKTIADFFISRRIHQNCLLSFSRSSHCQVESGFPATTQQREKGGRAPPSASGGKQKSQMHRPAWYQKNKRDPVGNVAGSLRSCQVARCRWTPLPGHLENVAYLDLFPINNQARGCSQSERVGTAPSRRRNNTDRCGGCTFCRAEKKRRAR